MFGSVKHDSRLKNSHVAEVVEGVQGGGPEQGEPAACDEVLVAESEMKEKDIRLTCQENLYKWTAILQGCDPTWLWY